MRIHLLPLVMAIGCGGALAGSSSSGEGGTEGSVGESGVGPDGGGGVVDGSPPSADATPDGTPGMPEATPQPDGGVIVSDATPPGCTSIAGSVSTSSSGMCAVSGKQTCGGTTYAVSCTSGGSSPGTCNCEISTGSSGAATIVNGYTSCSLLSAWSFCQANLSGFGS